jgi:carbamoyl-phosphate synthase large subunit
VLACAGAEPARADVRGEVVRELGAALGVVGLLNVQLALADGELYVLEANPRASRTVPFASKAIGVNLVQAACRLAPGDRSPTSTCRAGDPARSR